MLDQNTDRMWYVIDTLVVGAGISLLANKAIPKDATVGNQAFENKVTITRK